MNRLEVEGTKEGRYYQMALDQTRDILETCVRELSEECGRVVYEGISQRIKSGESIEEKLKRKGYKTDRETEFEKLNDIAGIRIICRFEDDIYRIRDKICEQKELKILKQKDFVERQKKSGYRSLHLIIKIPVATEEGMREMKVEIQIRTIVMHLWAELEHEKCYKKGKRDRKDSTYRRLKVCAKVGRALDKEMILAREAGGGEESND